jgi:multidrug efflux pump subunit AcrB
MPETPKSFIDWHKVATTTVTRVIMFTPGAVVVLGLFLLSVSQQLGDQKDWIIYHEETTDVIITQATAERGANLKKMNDNGEKMDKILEYMEQERIRLLTVQGRGRAGTFGGDDAFIRINRQSGRVRYQDGERVRVTLLNGDSTTSVVLPINGTFAHNNADLLMVFSRKACDDLGVNGIVDVKMEPLD